VCFNDVFTSRRGTSFTGEDPQMKRKPPCFKFLAVGLAVCLCLWIPACGKKGDTAQADTSTSPEITELTKEVRRYSFEKRKLPQKVEDLVAAGYIQSIPPAPAGKKYAIDTKRVEVILVNQ